MKKLEKLKLNEMQDYSKISLHEQIILKGGFDDSEHGSGSGSDECVDEPTTHDSYEVDQNTSTTNTSTGNSEDCTCNDYPVIGHTGCHIVAEIGDVILPGDSDIDCPDGSWD